MSLSNDAIQFITDWAEDNIKLYHTQGDSATAEQIQELLDDGYSDSLSDHIYMLFSNAVDESLNEVIDLVDEQFFNGECEASAYSEEIRTHIVDGALEVGDYDHPLLDSLTGSYTGFFQLALPQHARTAEDIADLFSNNSVRQDIVEALSEFGHDEDYTFENPVFVFYEDGQTVINAQANGATITDPYLFDVLPDGSLGVEVALTGHEYAAPVDANYRVDSLQGYSSVESIAGLSPYYFRDKLTSN